MTEQIQNTHTQDSQNLFAVAAERTETIRRFMAQYMVQGEDYGVIPGTSKPTLLKPGAQKLMSAFGLASVIKNVSPTLASENGFMMYEVTVTLLNKAAGTIEAEGVGCCNSQERRYRKQVAADVANTLLKMAKKRALVDAVIDATGASCVFTQDLEDMPRASFSDSHPNSNSNSHYALPSPPRPTAATVAPSSGRLNHAPPRDDAPSAKQMGMLRFVASQVPANILSDRFGYSEESAATMARRDISRLIDDLQAYVAQNPNPSTSAVRSSRAPRRGTENHEYFQAPTALGQ